MFGLFAASVCFRRTTTTQHRQGAVRTPRPQKPMPVTTPPFPPADAPAVLCVSYLGVGVGGGEAGPDPDQPPPPRSAALPWGRPGPRDVCGVPRGGPVRLHHDGGSLPRRPRGDRPHPRQERGAPAVAFPPLFCSRVSPFFLRKFPLIFLVKSKCAEQASF